jgi:hypothetical protein
MKKLAFLMISMLFCVACNNDIDVPEKAEDAGQQLELFIPDASKVSVYSTATVSECMIDTMYVLVFNADSSKRFVEKIGRDQIINNGQATQLLPQLKQTINNGDIVICIANVGSNPDTTSVTPSTINACFPIKSKSPMSHYRGGEYLPMYGEIKSWSAAGAYTCRMTRAVAKIQVQLGPSFSSTVSDFTVDNVIYRVRYLTASNFIQPQPAPNNTFLEIAHDQNGATGYLLQKADATEQQTNLFVHEFQSSIHGREVTTFTNTEWHLQRPYIAIEKGSAPNIKYYRLEFYDHARSEYIDILRNHHYLITINRVGSDGYDDINICERVPGSNLEFTITIDDDAQSITSNGQMALVTSADTVWISGDVTDQAVTKFRYIYPQGMPPHPDVLITDTIIVDTASIQPKNPTATLTITSPSGTSWRNNPMIKATNQDLKITTTGNLEEAVILFKCVNITHRLPVRKRP